MLSPRILRTKIIPPLRRARTLTRPRVSLILRQALDYRLTILQAGAGYGKSTALVELAEEIQPLVWYQVNEEDNDPLVFLLHLCHAIHRALPDLPDLPIHFLEAWDGTQGRLPWQAVLDQILNALTNLDVPTPLVLDDEHIVTESGEIVFILDRIFVPLLIAARQRQWESEHAAHLLNEIGLPGIQQHPGYHLRIQTLGAFQVWRGDDPIPDNGWRREKARQLFQLLLTCRNAPLDRDQICEHL